MKEIVCVCVWPDLKCEFGVFQGHHSADDAAILICYYLSKLYFLHLYCILTLYCIY